MKSVYIILMVVTGMLIPVMAALNAALSSQLKSVYLAVVIFFTIALIISLVNALLVPNVLNTQALTNFPKIPLVYFLGGIGVVIYITTVSIVGPKMGMGTSLACVLFGQLISMTLIDHFALMGMPRTTISIERVGGLLLMLAGLFILLFPPTKS